jgi:hypothetical protein
MVMDGVDYSQLSEDQQEALKQIVVVARSIVQAKTLKMDSSCIFGYADLLADALKKFEA